ncbi:MAG TPA: SpoIIE family protein phosphatase [Candidatus Elarobacter sp.]
MIEPPAAVRGRVLIVDDMESNRYVLCTWLRRAGYDVLEASTGEEALAIVRAESLDLVVLDINLPDMLGYDVCEQIKADARNASLPVLHVSATATDSADRSEGLRRGADGYLVEPIEREELIATVHALLRAARAQRTALRLSDRLRRLNEATFAVNEPVTIGQLVATIADQAAKLFGSPALAGVATDRAALLAISHPGAEPLVESHEHGIIGRLRRAAFEGTPFPRGVAFAPPVVWAELEDPAGASGVLLVKRPELDADDEPEEESEVVLAQFARAATLAIKNVRSFAVERQIALTLQQGLLPDVLESIAGVQLAARYEASTEHAEVGGDFYEVFALRDDCVALAIGDVVGHSLEAATVMAQLRAAIRSYMLEGHAPAPTLERLNRLLLRFHRDVTATVCCALYQPSTGRVEIANAGHMPPLVIGAGGARYVWGGGPLLGIEAAPPPALEVMLAPGETLMLFTDGLVERRGESIATGFDRLARAAEAAPDDVDMLCEQVLREVGPIEITDDIALVAIGRPR